MWGDRLAIVNVKGSHHLHLDTVRLKDYSRCSRVGVRVGLGVTVGGQNSICFGGWGQNGVWGYGEGRVKEGPTRPRDIQPSRAHR